MTEIVAGMSDAGGVLTAVWGLITGNPLMTFLLSVSVIGIGFRLLKKGKGAASGN